MPFPTIFAVFTLSKNPHVIVPNANSSLQIMRCFLARSAISWLVWLCPSPCYRRVYAGETVILFHIHRVCMIWVFRLAYSRSYRTQPISCLRFWQTTIENTRWFRILIFWWNGLYNPWNQPEVCYSRFVVNCLITPKQTSNRRVSYLPRGPTSPGLPYVTEHRKTMSLSQKVELRYYSK